MTERHTGRFWAWSRLALEDGPLRQALLTLQDAYGLNASLVLWCRWTELEGLGLTREDAITGIESGLAMDLYVVKRLRESRRFLATPRAGYPAEAMQRLRTEIHETEIAGEALIHARLEELTRARAAPEAADRLSGLDLFQLFRATVDVPMITAGTRGLDSPAALFETVRRLLPEDEKEQKPLSDEPGALEER
jgi:uncharacterized protein (TIGR02444 family)